MLVSLRSIINSFCLSQESIYRALVAVLEHWFHYVYHYVKKSEVWKDDCNNNKHCITVRNQTSAN